MDDASRRSERIRAAIAKAGQAQRPALTLFLTAGLPDPGRFLQTLVTLADAGADILEIGMPYSDPLADGPTIQASSHQALEMGVTLPWIFDQIRAFRAIRDTPVVLMGYVNPVLQYGFEAFAAAAVDAGADGVILPDVPLEEMSRALAAFAPHGLPIIGLVTPTSTSERIRRLDEMCDGFLYAVMVTGVTGGDTASDSETASIRDFLGRVRDHASRLPVQAGFGIRRRADAEPFADLVDGIIVGSELIRLIDAHRDRPDLQERLASFTGGFVRARPAEA
jgi:tryptophan synthase alpha chain